MNIILENELTDDIQSRYLTLELDTFEINNSTTVRSYALIDRIALEEMFDTKNFIELHSNLIKNYRLQNWKYCEDAIEYLRDRWDGQLQSFYLTLKQRIENLKNQELPSSWNGNIHRYQDPA